MSVRVNLFIIGAMKSGTTSLHEYLNKHPQIAMSTEKEPGYFVEELSWARGECWYQSLFEPTADALYSGESSTHYTKFPLYRGVARRISNYNHNARLIYIMRNPFERMVSHYWHEVRAAYDGGELSNFAAAIKIRPDYLNFSNYPLQLEQYYEFFPKEQIYIVTFEELVKEPDEVCNAIFEWLNLPAITSQAVAGHAFNAQPEQIRGSAGLGLLNRIQYSKTWARISPLIPKNLKNAANKAAYKTVDKHKQEKQINKLKTDLAPHFTDQTQQLKIITGRDFPEWPDYN